MYKAPQLRATLGHSHFHVQKVPAVVARSTFGSKKCQRTSASEHFLEVEMWKKYMPLWREAHVEVKMHKAPRVWGSFGLFDGD